MACSAVPLYHAPFNLKDVLLCDCLDVYEHAIIDKYNSDLRLKTESAEIARPDIARPDNQSINQSKHIPIAPYVASESEAHNAAPYRKGGHRETGFIIDGF